MDFIRTQFMAEIYLEFCHCLSGSYRELTSLLLDVRTSNYYTSSRSTEALETRTIKSKAGMTGKLLKIVDEISKPET